MTRPVVSPEEFAFISCNRCGDCCQRFTAPDSKTLLRYIGHNAKDPSWGDGRIAFWASHLVPLDEEAEDPGEGRIWYRCDLFERDEEGLWVCTAHDRRPDVCRDFPYGRPVTYKRCSWNVGILPEDILSVI